MPISLALLTRPVWQGQTAGVKDPRILAAPLQLLDPIDPPDRQLASLMQARSGWLVFTSPASVDAFCLWLQSNQVSVVLNPGIKIFALGQASQERICDSQARNFFSARQLENIVCGPPSSHADAKALLGVMQEIFLQGDRPSQVFLVQGEDPSPSLGLGLKDLGLEPTALILYRRIKTQWSDQVITALRSSPEGQAAIVVTSSQAVELALAHLKSAGIAPQALTWATHHQTIAQALKEHKLKPILRVRLNASELPCDLFENEQTW